MKLLAQKSLKTDLRLKRYEVLKLKGLDFNYKMKTGARLEFTRRTGTRLRMQHFQGILGFYF
jgi:hypothetical protein